MNHKTGTIESYDGLKLYYQVWLPSETPIGRIAYFHGGGGHSGQPTYTHFARYFLEKGYAIYGLDQRGHGMSEGQPYHIESIQDIRRDIQDFINFVKSEGENEAVFAVGQSMGGLFLLEFCLHHSDDIAGAIVVAPGLTLEGLPSYLILIFRLLSRILPRKQIKIKLDMNHLSRDPDEVERMKTDPLSNLSSTPRTGVQILDTIDWVHKNAGNFNTPLLMIHGEDDRVSMSSSSQAFFENVTMADKSLIIYPGGYHQPFIDINKEEVFKDMADWLEVH